MKKVDISKVVVAASLGVACIAGATFAVGAYAGSWMDVALEQSGPEESKDMACDLENAEATINCDMDVDDAVKALIEQGYCEEDLVFAELVTEIESIKEQMIINESVNSSEETDEPLENSIIQEVDKFIEQEQSDRGVISDNLKGAIDIWKSLTSEEKALVVKHPKKALVGAAASNRATEIAIAQFGYNGLGDPCDAFRHATWCALMTRDAGKEFAEAYSLAHESGKTEEDLQMVASDGCLESEHLAMDLHNNAEGIKLIESKNMTDRDIVGAVLNKMTGNKATGIYWLHN